LISEKTVRKHLEHIYRKLKIHSHIEAVAWAWKEGLVKGATLLVYELFLKNWRSYRK